MMLNAGCGGDPSQLPADGRYPIDTLLVRDFLRSPALAPGSVTPADAARQIYSLPGNATTASGGVLPNGGILVIAQPHGGIGAADAADGADGADGGLIFEGDRDGGTIRRAYPEHEGGDASAHTLFRSPPQTLLTTNHWHEYKTDPWEADYWADGAGGRTCPSAAAAATAAGQWPVGYDESGAVSFSSLWRYKSALGLMGAQRRARTPVGTEAVRAALRVVAEGETEHSIVVRPHARLGRTSFDLAVASGGMAGTLWDAPYEEWTTFGFEEVFLAVPEEYR